MADPESRDASLRRTYELSIPVLDIQGDAPATAPLPVSVRVERVDSGATAQLFGPDGVLSGDLASVHLDVEPRPSGSALSPATAVIQLIPSDYWFVSTRYVLTVQGRIYTFRMPAQDVSLIELLSSETDPDPDDGESPAPAASVGTLLGWWGSGDLPPAESRVEVPIRDGRPALALSHAGTGGPVKLNLAHSADLDDRVESILIDGVLWTPEPLIRGATTTESSLAYRLYSSRNAVDVTGCSGPRNVELVLRPAT